MPSRRVGGGTTKRKHSLGNLRRAHPASGATWNVQVVRGKMSSKCLWHACRALILGLTLMLLGAGMATLGYYADHLSMGSELRGNVTVRVKNDLKGFHLNNFAYVGPIVMGFGGFIVVASCVMTFEARDSAAKVVPARLRAGGGGSSKNPSRSNQGSSASQRRGMGAQYQSSRWDQHFGVFRSSPGDPHQQPQTACISTTHPHQHSHPQQPFDREALTAELVQFSRSLSASNRFSPQWRRLSGAGSAPDLSGSHAHANTTNSTNATNHQNPTTTVTTNYCNLLSLNRLSPLDWELYCSHRRHRRHHHRHSHHHHHHHKSSSSSVRRVRPVRPGLGAGSQPSGGGGGGGGAGSSSSARIISNSSSLIQRATRECSLLQPPAASRVYWQASSFDGGSNHPPGLAMSSSAEKRSERNKRSDTAKRHVLSRQRPIEQEEARDHSRSPLGHRRNSTMSDSSYSGRWTARCASIASRTSSIESRRVQVDLHSPEVMPKSILRSPKRYSSGPSATPSVEKEFRSQLSVCSEPPPPVRQLSGQSSMEPAVPEESLDQSEEQEENSPPKASYEEITELQHHTSSLPPKKARPGFLPLARSEQEEDPRPVANPLYRSNSSRQFYRPKKGVQNERDDSVFYIRSMERGLAGNGACGSADEQMYDSLRVINERRTTLLKADSQGSLGSAERKLSSFSLKMPEITERENSIEIEMDADELHPSSPPSPPPPPPPPVNPQATESIQDQDP
ncbi:histone-lysine N-methyltransferase Suv4-20 isoform X1 [Drosophila mauritiana]|uniref:Histone-lysine N-methyltransferase Suv4-20 isoform X1 n=1 Tax=Drosophila mauritiana TaxID=7226 RepID=A0A6P8JT64_DROMA|nr:histone-lysine N-methyltransferase Suv4-20 isoform X1 [Drosophila mauritiana]XP_033159395.1 histone-lysine N-methyltransferase Suv4-20 isoform X1 [Drosophila mauritiana]